MKKFLVMLLVSAAMLAVSCEQDGIVYLSGTTWRAALSEYGLSGEYVMSFITDSTGRMDYSVSEGEGDVESDSLPFTYTFDGMEKGVLDIETGGLEQFTYARSNGKPTITVVFSEEEAAEMGFSRMLFRRV